MSTGEQDIFPYRPPNNTERHIQTIVLGLILASLAWLGSVIIATHDSQIQLTSQIAEIQRRMLLLEASTSAFIQRSEYDRDTGLMVRKLENVDSRVREIEQRRTR